MFKEQDFSITKSTIVYDHYIKVKQDIVNTPNGTIVDYNYIYSNTNAVLVLPIHDNKIIMLKQYRYPLKKYVYDLPGGGTKVGDTTLETAKKELKEETGYEAKSFEYINSFYHIPGYSNITVETFIAKDLKPGESELEKSEFAEVVEFTFKEFESLLISEKMEGTIAATYFCAKLKNLI